MTESDKDFVREVVGRNRYLTLATTDGKDPWAAPLEYLSDDSLNLYYFSPEAVAHSQHILDHSTVAIAIFDGVQPEYEPAPVMRIAGVQATATVEKLEAPFPALVQQQIEAWNLPMPPYAVYKVVAKQWYIPVIKDGINERLKVTM